MDAQNTQKLISDIYATVDREAVIKMVVGDKMKVYSSYIAFVCPCCGEFKGFIRKPSGAVGGNVAKCSRATCEMHEPMSLIDFVAGSRKARGKTFQMALKNLAGLIGKDYEANCGDYVPLTVRRKEQLKAKIQAKIPANYYSPKPELEKDLAKLRLNVNRTVIDYLKTRGIPYQLAKSFEVGFAPWKQWPHVNDEGKYVRQWIKGRVVFPVRNHKGELMNLYGRALEDGTKECPKEWRHDFLPGTKGVGNQKDLLKNKVHLVEGYFDLLSAKAARPNIDVAAIFGVHGFDWDLVKAEHVCFCFDLDVAGEQWRELADAGIEKGKNIYHLNPSTYEGFKDLNEVWKNKKRINFQYLKYGSPK